MFRRAFCSSLVAALCLLSCDNSGRKVAPPFGVGGGGSDGSSNGDGDLGFDAGGPQGPPAADAGGLCGNQVHQVLTDPPNVYFVFDISGSMGTPVSGGTRFSVVQIQAAKLVKDLRYAIKVGAAAFPLGVTDEEACTMGGQVYPVTFDDPSGFDNATKTLVPYGGTPTAATLTSLKPLLQGLPGKTVVVLATDGGPNCNASAMCDVSECQENIEGCVPGESCCAQGTNCCAPGATAGPSSCTDHAASVKAVADIWAAGIKVYVVGIPGSQQYGKVLSDMALAGGAAQFASPFYYEVDDLANLGFILQTIAGAQISCDIPISDPPQDQNYTNVYFDQDIIPSDPQNGWTWSSASMVTLHGAACTKLKSGLVAQVQIVSGCATEVSK